MCSEATHLTVLPYVTYVTYIRYTRDVRYMATRLAVPREQPQQRVDALEGGGRVKSRILPQQRAHVGEEV